MPRLKPPTPPSTGLPHGWPELAAAATTKDQRDLLNTLARRIERADLILHSVDGLGQHCLDVAEVDQLLEIVRDIAPARSTPPASTPYERQRQRSARYQLDKSRQVREIGPLPPIDNPKRRSHAERDLKFYLETYHAPAFPFAWSQDHLLLIKRAEVVIRQGALFALAMPRGSGKTTLCRHACQWAINYGFHRYVFLIGANEDKGEEALQTIQQDYEGNAELLADFPEICFPLVKLDGIHNRAKGQLLNGQRTRVKFQKRTLILPTVANSPSSGAVIKAGGLLSSLRGANQRMANGTIERPSLLLIDDPQTRESAESPDQSSTRTRIISADVLGMSGPGGEIAALMPCTVIAPGDMADTILDTEKHPSWRGVRTSMLLSFPENMELWEEYWDIFTRALQGMGDEEAEAIPAVATEFYRQHQKAMDKGARVSWDARKRPDEPSAIQHAMNLFLRDEAAFFSEYQNDPRDPNADEELLTASEIVTRTNNFARGEIPHEVDWLTLFVDCHKRALMWMVMGFEWNFSGYVIDYGCFPEQPRPTFKMRRANPTLQMKYRGSGVEGALYKGLTELIGGLLERTWSRADGTALQIERGMIDQQYLTSTVHKVIRDQKWTKTIYPSIGRELTPGETPISQYRRKPGEVLGQEFIVRRGRGTLRQVMVDANYWKSFSLRRLATNIGDPGSCTLFGYESKNSNGKRRKANHEFLATQLTSESRTRIIGGERATDMFRLKPGGENHWFDCFYNCHTLGSWVGARTTGQRESTTRTRNRKSLAERRAAKRSKSR
ncbi:Phage terminase large subunit (GpA) [Thalassoglobus neptunius]|uniref:Phage terminase large subunit (GpA) n=1 Tax=Thalassoglobus neptunius TaxID=1938619 RepID=A0A5C5VWK0_9PLAN|nr:terminase gpA endonuclease subunit [Thalassoglobus neptunius]TWT43056.1 Phage terminase large subunit (GpA) [Thalassoglobus neptunius]